MTKRFKVPGTFTVPDTIEGVRGLFTARGWEKAGIVYAYTKNEGRGGDQSNAQNGALPTEFPCSMAEFARLGITGLTKRDTVAFYRDQWADAMKKRKAKATKIGETFDVPALEFPPTGHDKQPSEAEIEAAEEAGVSAKQVARIASNTKVIQAAYKADPNVRKAVNAAREEVITEMASRTREKAKARGGSSKPVPEVEETIADEAVSLADGAVEEGERREALHELQTLAATIREKAEQWAETYAYTGVSDEVEWVHEISANLTEAQWKIAAFAVEQEQEA